MNMPRQKAQSRRMKGKAAGHPWTAGFTLVEVLATLVLMGILLPVAMGGLVVALNAASSARNTADAARLAQIRLNEIALSGQWSSLGDSGDFGPQWPQFRWTCHSIARDWGLVEVTLTVAWTQRNLPRSLTLSTLVLDQQVRQ